MPGYIIVKLLKLSNLKIVDIIILSAGLSLLSVMLLGLLINQLYLFGLSQPLSEIPLTIGVSIFVLSLACINERVSSVKYTKPILIKCKGSLLIRALSLVLLPVLGAASAFFWNIPILIFVIGAIGLLFIVSLFKRGIIPQKLYPLLIFTISLTLLFHVVFTSKNIIGFDAKSRVLCI